LDTLLEQEVVEAYQLVGRSHDCGTKIGYLMANVIYGERHPEVGEAFKTFLKAR
jgi:UTP--glucose-1-phosphate uridylyltransferase